MNQTQHVRHPCVYSESILEKLKQLIIPGSKILDPFAGTGKIAKLKNLGLSGIFVCNELEADYQQLCNYPVDEWHIGDAENMKWASDNSFDAIVTSPTYGNRMADNWIPKDASTRISYTFWMGHTLDSANTGRMQWGEQYRTKHERIYPEFYRILRPMGKMLVNLSNHIRKGIQIDVIEWHKSIIIKTGFSFENEYKIKTPRMRYGKNHEKRIDYEVILEFYKPLNAVLEMKS